MGLTALYPLKWNDAQFVRLRWYGCGTRCPWAALQSVGSWRDLFLARKFVRQSFATLIMGPFLHHAN